MKQSDAASSPEMEALRNILIGEERRELDGMRHQLEAVQAHAETHQDRLAELTQLTETLQARAEDHSAFRDATAEALPYALKQAGKTDHAAVSRALSPYVVSSIRKEIVNSRDEMVDALYPITGRLVTAAVRNSIAKLSEDINERMNALTSTAMWSARVSAWRTGEPVSKFVLASGRDFHVLRAMLLDRGAGTPLSVVESDDVPERSDTNLISGLLAALSNLAQEVYKSAEDELRRVDLNGRQIAFRRSAAQLLVVEFVGQLPAEVQAEIDRRFVDIVSLGERDDQEALDEAVASLLELKHEPEEDEANPRTPYAKWAMIGLAVVALGWILGSAIGRWQLDNTAGRVQAIVDGDDTLRAYPISVDARYDNSDIVVRGLLPHSASEQALREKMTDAAGTVPVELALTRVVDRQSVEQARSEVTELRAENQALQDALAGMQLRLGEGDYTVLPEEVRSITEHLDRLDSVFEDSRQKLVDATQGATIRFSSGVTLEDPATALETLRGIAALLAETPDLLVITPNQHESASDFETWALARARYVRTQLLREGVAAVQVKLAAPVTVDLVDDARSVLFSIDTGVSSR